MLERAAEVLFSPLDALLDYWNNDDFTLTFCFSHFKRNDKQAQELKNQITALKY